MMHTMATPATDHTPATDLARRVELQRRACLIAGLAGVDPRTARGALVHGPAHVRSNSARARIVDAAEQLGIELP